MFLIRIILVFLFLYLLLYIAGKLFALWFRNSSHKYSGTHHTGGRREGEVIVEDQKKARNKKFDKNEGEYISFEEIDES